MRKARDRSEAFVTVMKGVDKYSHGGCENCEGLSMLSASSVWLLHGPRTDETDATRRVFPTCNSRKYVCVCLWSCLD